MASLQLQTLELSCRLNHCSRGAVVDVYTYALHWYVESYILFTFMHNLRLLVATFLREVRFIVDVRERKRF